MQTLPRFDVPSRTSTRLTLMKLFVCALSIPLLALVASACRAWTSDSAEWKKRLKIALVLFGLGAYAAGPFLNGSWVGTGEAYNYDLSIADGVTQYRAGVFPIFVGQTQYAFNGRIHPLRTAPYYVYAACAIDALTFCRLDFWELQDLLLVLSIIGGTFSCYASLRYLIGASRKVSMAASALYIFSPGVLSAVYSMDLFMTVTTLPFLPLAVGAVLRSATDRDYKITLILGVSVGMTWLAHPPVALWLSTFTVITEVVFILRRFPSGREWLSLIFGAVSGLLMAIYSFASTFSFRSGGGFMEAQDYSPLHEALQRAFPGALLPPSANAELLSDFQLGYVFWLLILAATIGAAVRRRIDILAICLISSLFLILVLPVPHVSWWLWRHLPPVFPNLTNIWPMQRLYLVVTALVLCAAVSLFGDSVDASLSKSKLSKWALGCTYLIALGWTVFQAQPYIHRGSASVRSKTSASEKLRSENIDLTVISYALLGTPSYYNYGTVDPERWFRLLNDDDLSQLATNWDPSNPGPLKAEGEFKIAGTNAVGMQLEPDLRIGPHRKYLLVFHFRSPPIHALLVISGEHFYREYTLPSSDQSHGFGMRPSDQHALVLWTSNPGVTTLHFQIVGVDPATGLLGQPPAFTLYQIDPEHFPVRVDGWVPLMGTIDSPKSGWVETPRRFIPGYTASVDGKPTEVKKSPEDAVMFRIPSGKHEFTLSYPGTPFLRIGFWISFWSFVGLVLYILFAAIRALRAGLRGSS